MVVNHVLLSSLFFFIAIWARTQVRIIKCKSAVQNYMWPWRRNYRGGTICGHLAWIISRLRNSKLNMARRRGIGLATLGGKWQAIWFPSFSVSGKRSCASPFGGLPFYLLSAQDLEKHELPSYTKVAFRSFGTPRMALVSYPVLKLKTSLVYYQSRVEPGTLPPFHCIIYGERFFLPDFLLHGLMSG